MKNSLLASYVTMSERWLGKEMYKNVRYSKKKIRGGKVENI